MTEKLNKQQQKRNISIAMSQIVILNISIMQDSSNVLTIVKKKKML